MANPMLETSIAMAERQGWRLVGRTETSAELEHVPKAFPPWWWLLIYWPVVLLRVLYRLTPWGKKRNRLRIEIDAAGRITQRRWAEPPSN